jgi:hypothetical protein
MNSREIALIGGLILLSAAFFYFGYLFRGQQPNTTQQIVQQQIESSPTPTIAPTTAPVNNELEDNPERINNDDNPGESNRRGRGRD